MTEAEEAAVEVGSEADELEASEEETTIALDTGTTIALVTETTTQALGTTENSALDKNKATVSRIQANSEDRNQQVFTIQTKETNQFQINSHKFLNNNSQ